MEVLGLGRHGRVMPGTGKLNKLIDNYFLNRSMLLQENKALMLLAFIRSVLIQKLNVIYSTGLMYADINTWEENTWGFNTSIRRTSSSWNNISKRKRNKWEVHIRKLQFSNPTKHLSLPKLDKNELGTI